MASRPFRPSAPARPSRQARGKKSAEAALAAGRADRETEAMTLEQLRAELAAQGIDPDAQFAKQQAMVATALAARALAEGRDEGLAAIQAREGSRR